MKAREFNFRNRKVRQMVLMTGIKTPSIIYFATKMGIVINPESKDLFYQLTDEDERNIYYAIKQGASESREIAELVQKAEEEYVPVDWELEEKFFNRIVSGYFKGEDLDRIEKYYETFASSTVDCASIPCLSKPIRLRIGSVGMGYHQTHCRPEPIA